MRKRRRNQRTEKMILLCSSAAVLTILTFTGVYVKDRREIKEDKVIDLSMLEERENTEESKEDKGYIEPDKEKEITPVDSKKVKNKMNVTKEEKESEAEIIREEKEIVFFEDKKEEEILEFSEDDKLLWPIVGNILIDFSMDKPVYFATLNQYKYHPGIVIQATEGQQVNASARGKVISIKKEDQLGNVITVDLGSGYEVKYGQLTNIQVKEGDIVEQGTYLADVAKETKFFSVEGCNIYFELQKDKKPINPMEQLKQET